jgi:hypothetical protein
MRFRLCPAIARLSALIACALLFLITSSPAASQQPFPTPTPFSNAVPQPMNQPASTQTAPAHVTPKAGISLSARAAFGGHAHVGRWLPIHVDVRNEGVDFTGTVVIGAQSDALYTARVAFPGGSQKRITVYTVISSFTRNLSVRLLEGSQTLAQTDAQVIPHNDDELLVGVLAPQRSGLRLPEMNPASGIRFTDVEIDPQDLPDRAEGLAPFDAIVLGDLAPGQVSEAQGSALTSWVARGGRLVIGGGAGAAATLANLPAELRPAEVQSARETSETKDLALLAGSADLGPGALSVVQANPLVGAFVRAGGDPPLLIERSVGKGAALFLTVSLDAPALAQWEETPAMWRELLLVLSPPPSFGLAPPSINNDQMFEANLAQSLMAMPALELPDLRQLGALLLIYVVVVGPGTFFVLRRLDRQAWGWVVVPLVTLVFAAGTYALGYSKRGGDVIVNQIDILEPFSERGTRVRSFVGIFSPSRREFQAETPGGPLTRPIQGQWDQSSQQGWFGAGTVERFPVSKWSLGTFVAEHQLPTGSLDGQLVIDGTTLRGQVVNNGAQTIEDVALVQGSSVARIGALGPGERRDVELPFTNDRQALIGAPMLSSLLLAEQGAGAYPAPNVAVDIKTQQFNQGDTAVVVNGPGPFDGNDPQQRRRMVLDLLFPDPAARSPEPLLIGWVDGSSFATQLPNQQRVFQQTSLTLATPRWSAKSGEVTLGGGWMRQELTLGDDAPPGAQPFCSGSWRNGFYLGYGAVYQTMTLPTQFAGLLPSEATLLPAADGAWPTETKISLLDWQTGEWVEQKITDTQPTLLPTPERFVHSQTGQIKLRIEGATDPFGSCMYLDMGMSGRIP